MPSSEKAGRTARGTRGRPRGWVDKTEQNTIKSLDRAMEVFERLSQRTGRTLTGLAGELGQSPATVYRILITLERRGLTEFDHSAQLWHIGAKAFIIGSGFLRRTSLAERARPMLRRLMEETGETANLGVARSGSVLFVSQVETHASIRAFFPPGTMSAMHASGIGKALLAEMPADRLEEFLKGEALEGFTPLTLATPEALRADLAAIRQRGYSVDNEEKNTGMRCIAAPVFDLHGEAVAGISVSGPSARMGPENTEALAGAVMEAAAGLTASLGGATPPRAP